MRCALLHGFAGDCHAWNDVIAAWQLPDPPRAIALPGHGGGPVHATWDANLDAVAAAIAGCEVAVGYSLGARVALGLVASGRCKRGVLISVNPGIDDKVRAERLESDARWAKLLRDQGVAAFEQAWTAQPLFATQVRVSEDKRAARRTKRLALDPEQLAQSLEAMGVAAMPDYRAQLAANHDRVSLIVGADDAKFVAIAQALSGISNEAIADSGHDLTLEQPERLAAAIARAVVRLA